LKPNQPAAARADSDPAITIETLSVFPTMFAGEASPANTSIVGRAQKAGILRLINHDLRDWTHDRHRTTDDAPYGGDHGL
jgi:tRNA (guanine37-N1)-methyltransferase